MKIKLFRHQKRALRRSLNRPFYPLFMEMGTGKTAVAIKNIETRWRKGLLSKVIIFAPKNILFNWELEFPKFFELDPSEYVIETLPEKTKPKRVKSLQEFYDKDHRTLTLKQLHSMGYEGKKADIVKEIKPPLQILIVNYEKAIYMYKELLKFKPDMLVVDESHRLRNRNAQISKRIYGLTKRCEYKLILTGTPICKGYEDIFMQYKIVNDLIFGSHYGDFEDRYIVKGGYMGYDIVDYKNVDELKEIIEQTSFNVRIEDCIDLPEQLPDLHLTCELSAEARKHYNQLNKDLETTLDIVKEDLPRAEIKQTLRDHKVPFEARASYRDLLWLVEERVNVTSVELAITKTLRLHQIAGGFITSDSGKVVQVCKSKSEALKDYISDYGKQVVIFCKFIPEIEFLQKELSKLTKGFGKQKKNLRVETITGKTKDIKPINLDFLDKKIDVLICQISAGSVGLNLYSAARVIFYSWDTRYDEYYQAIARIKRNGQREPWQVVHVITEDTEDLNLIKTLHQKKAMVDNILKK